MLYGPFEKPLANTSEAFLFGDLLSALGVSAQTAMPDGPKPGDDGQPPASIISVVNNGAAVDPAGIATSFLDDNMLSNGGQPNYEGAEQSMNEGIIVITSAEPTEQVSVEVTTPTPVQATNPIASPAPAPVEQKPADTNVPAVKQADEPKKDANPKCADKYPKVICENYRLYGYCDSLKSRLAFYCERTCGMCSDECVNEDSRCTQTEFHCKPEISNIPNSSCQALCGGCEVKLSAEQHEKLKEYLKREANDSSEQKLQHNVWPNAKNVNGKA
ncbi:hypothetical protein DdX_08896 [Ditylenchus destructor]|uniref:ShKT domain-containing protein n=1 Tax=Ditylenchus destructor TaxID=166010 RepID=A0AAD4R6S7_9BILA|nr:hypothetical protein DdX_08896 [Ditylenchus destructor]